ncbi:MAG: phosphate acyltransferase PlsX [Candidatus Neomarinimicrobiota bacterium]
MKIVIDSMGGDHAPHAVIKGTIDALKETRGELDVLLTGSEELIRKELSAADFTSEHLEIHHTTQQVEMTDPPSQVVKKKPDSSLVTGIRLVRDGIGAAFVSAGSTGAVLSSALFLLGRIEGVLRPALGVYFPVRPRGLVLCDIGANVEAKPRHFLQFAIMASEYIKHIWEVEYPRIGLLNIGVEPTKGTDVYLEVHKLLKNNLPNFRGNIESRHLLDGLVDVAVCDGFVGNTLVKFAEGWIGHVRQAVFRQLDKTGPPAADKKILSNLFTQVMREYEYEEYGGVPLLGVNGICIVCHGSSPRRAIKNAILAARKSVEEHLVESIREDISSTVSLLKSSR